MSLLPDLQLNLILIIVQPIVLYQPANTVIESSRLLLQNSRGTMMAQIYLWLLLVYVVVFENCFVQTYIPDQSETPTRMAPESSICIKGFHLLDRLNEYHLRKNTSGKPDARGELAQIWEKLCDDHAPPLPIHSQQRRTDKIVPNALYSPVQPSIQLERRGFTSSTSNDINIKPEDIQNKCVNITLPNISGNDVPYSVNIRIAKKKEKHACENIHECWDNLGLDLLDVHLQLEGKITNDILLCLFDWDWMNNVRSLSVRKFYEITFDLCFLQKIPNLEVIDFSNNRIVDLQKCNSSASLLIHHNLTHLILTNNTINTIDSNALHGLTKLMVLDLGINRIDFNGFNDVILPSSLKKLNLTQNLLSHVPTVAFTSLMSIISLDLQKNALRTINTTFFSKMHELQILHLGNNMLTSIINDDPKSLSQLQVFHIEFNQLEDLPESFLQRSINMTNLKLGNNRLTRLPEFFLGHHNSLQELSLEDNQLKSIKCSWFADSHTNLTVLNIASNKIDSLPGCLSIKAPNLKHFHLQHNRIQKMNFNLYFSKMKEFDITSNELTWISKEFLEKMPSIEILHLDNNKLTKFPSTTLHNLTLLKLEHNHITIMPNVSRLPSLHSLFMNGHAIDTIQFETIFKGRKWQEVHLAVHPQHSSIGTLNSRTEFIVDSLDVIGIDLKGPLFSRNIDLKNAKFLALGWSGLNESVYPSRNLCDFLERGKVSTFVMTKTAYEHIECFSSSLKRLALQENIRLKKIQFQESIDYLNISKCENLIHLSIPSVSVLDISETKVKPSRQLCRTWGRELLIARKWQPEFSFDHSKLWTKLLLQQCLYDSSVRALDLSGVNWFQNPEIVQSVVSQPIVLDSRKDTFRHSSVTLHKSQSAPLLQLSGTRISCQLNFRTLHVIATSENGISRPNLVLVFQYDCDCAEQYVRLGNDCNPRNVEFWPVVVGTLFGFFLFQIGVYLIVVYYRRHKNLWRENELNIQLLSEKDAEVLALKAAWEIPSSELSFQRHICAGAFGDVWEGQWDTLRVAIKVMKSNIYLVDDGFLEEFEKEVEFLQRTRHPNLVRFFGAGRDIHTRPFIVLEYIELGSLKDFLKQDLSLVLSAHHQEQRDTSVYEKEGDSERSVSQSNVLLVTVWDLKLQLASDIACGMAFIHSLEKVHRYVFLTCNSFYIFPFILSYK